MHRCFNSKSDCCSPLSRAAADYTEIKNDFMACRESLPVMFIATPKDKKSLWTKRAPSVQVSVHTNTSTQLAQQHIYWISTQYLM